MSDLPAKCVLIVDDDVDICETIQTILEVYGYRVITAADGADALKKLQGGVSPCVILLDLMMPGMNGPQFRHEQLCNPALAKIPVVVLSGDNQIASKAAALGLERLRKPVQLEALLAKIQHFCGPAE